MSPISTLALLGLTHGPLLLVVGTPAPARVAALALAAPAPNDVEAKIEALWRLAGAHWDTANYADAIGVYEQGLTLALANEHWSAPHLQVALAESHLRQYLVDGDRQHLGKSRELFRDFSRGGGANSNEDLRERAKLGLAEAERRLAEHKETPATEAATRTDPDPDPEPEPSASPDEPQSFDAGSGASTSEAGRPSRRALSMAALGTGFGLLGGGVGLLAHGARVESIGLEQVGDEGLAANQRTYIDGLERKLFISGAVLGAVGVGLTVAGAIGLVRNRQASKLSVRAGFSPTRASFTLVGRF